MQGKSRCTSRAKHFLIREEPFTANTRRRRSQAAESAREAGTDAMQRSDASVRNCRRLRITELAGGGEGRCRWKKCLFQQFGGAVGCSGKRQPALLPSDRGELYQQYQGCTVVSVARYRGLLIMRPVLRCLLAHPTTSPAAAATTLDTRHFSSRQAARKCVRSSN